VSKRNVLVAIYKRNDGFPVSRKNFPYWLLRRRAKMSFRSVFRLRVTSRILSFSHSPSKVILMHYWPDLSHFSSTRGVDRKVAISPSRLRDGEIYRWDFRLGNVSSGSRSGLN